MSICINCGNGCEEILCDICDKSIDKEKLIRELCIFNPRSSENALWKRISEGLFSPYNFCDAAFAVAGTLPSPRKEYMTLVWLLRGGGDYVAKNSRKWLYDNASVLLGDGLDEKEKNVVYLALFYNYVNDHRYSEAEETAKLFFEKNYLERNQIYALCDYLIKTRRYKQADDMLKNAIERSRNDSILAMLKKLRNKSDEIQRGKENGGKSEHMPTKEENKIKYVEFMKSLGIDVQMPVKKNQGVRKKISAADYPMLPAFRDAGFKSFVAYDIETTGINAKFDSIIEIGAVRVVNGVVSEEEKFTFHSFVRPYKTSVKKEITELTGITPEMVKNAPEMWDAFNAFADFAGDDILVGFNNNSFDDKFIVRAGRYAKRIITNKSFDVMTYADIFREKLDLGNGKISLRTLSDILGIENPCAHRALADALTTARVYLKLLETDNVNKSVSFDDILTNDDWM